MNSGNLQTIFGDEIAGIPTETVLAITQAQIWGGGDRPAADPGIGI